ncbi:DUF1376 domain-containing protein [Acidithiobacillus sp. IBUN Pt1247-S3]|uniref:DUF1376 domain-containing protein n=1 Tax=Acidithiobacillus sp. IBUN Pt1247-S3 TaxID=3166642 RepID=UPI0034E448FC
MCNQPIPFFAGTSDIEPPIPQDADLRSVRWYKLDMVSLLNSDFMQLASPEEFKAAFLLWTKSIHQVPAGSLPNDEAILAKLAGGYDHRRKLWERIRAMVLHGWDLCSDGRLYHQAVAGTVLDILASAHAPTAVTAPQSARDIAREKAAERQRRFREKQRNLRTMEAALARQDSEVAPTPASVSVVTPESSVTSPVTPVTLRVTPVTLPIKEEDKDEDKEVTLRVTLPVTEDVTPPVTSQEPLPESGDTFSPTREGTLCKQLRALGVRAAPHMVVVKEMCSRHSDEHIIAAAEIALEKKGAGIHVGYIAAMLKDPGSGKNRAKSKPPAGPPNRQLIPPVAVGSSHYAKL